jgi:hypothetical protein
LDESRPNSFQNAAPVPRFRLAKLPKRRIPRAVIPVSQPTPACVEAIKEDIALWAEVVKVAGMDKRCLEITTPTRGIARRFRAAGD